LPPKNITRSPEVGEIDEDAGKLYYFNKYLKSQTRHWNKGVKTEEPEQLDPSQLLLDAKLQEKGDKGTTCSCLSL
jgi:hypothetical protein